MAEKTEAFVLSKPGDSRNLKLQNVPLPETLGDKDVLVRHTYIGVNFDDVLFRRGDLSMDLVKSNEKDLDIIGKEAVGIVEAVGPKVPGFKPGDRVAYATAPMGTYAKKRVIPASYLVQVPNEIHDKMAAAILRRGLAAHYLIFRTYKMQPGHNIMVYSAAGGLGQILSRWASFHEVNVIGLVGSDDKKSIAQAAGCKHVINYRKDKVLDAVKDITEGTGVNAVFDGVGKDTYQTSLDCLTPFGIFASLGSASGKIEKIIPDDFLVKSLFFTRPTVELYKAPRMELVLSAQEVFTAFMRGIISVNINEYGFEAIPQAHAELDSGKTMGSLVVKV